MQSFEGVCQTAASFGVFRMSRIPQWELCQNDFQDCARSLSGHGSFIWGDGCRLSADCPSKQRKHIGGQPGDHVGVALRMTAKIPKQISKLPPSASPQKA